MKKKNAIKSSAIPLTTINKFISHVLSEILKTEDGYRIPLHVFCFDLVMKRYGLKSIAEQKI